ncbi:hypothetical protein JXA12_03200 [Candidatus Woesearchaeota archaeon]|nr:hypothetical protein [Candidatus Woesearchaeota archaeon]
MRIAVEPGGETLKISFTGAANMEQSITLTKDDAQQLRELLNLDEAGFFETD